MRRSGQDSNIRPAFHQGNIRHHSAYGIHAVNIIGVDAIAGISGGISVGIKGKHGWRAYRYRLSRKDKPWLLLGRTFQCRGATRMALS